MANSTNTPSDIKSLKNQLHILQFLVFSFITVSIFTLIPEAFASIKKKITVSEIVLVDQMGKTRYKLYIDEHDRLVESISDADGRERFKLEVLESGVVNIGVASDWKTEGWKLSTQVDKNGDTTDVVVTQGAAFNKSVIISAARSNSVTSGLVSEDGNDFAGMTSNGINTRLQTVRDGDIRFSAELGKDGSGIFLMDKNNNAQFVMALRENDNKLVKIIASTPGEEIWSTISSIMTAKGVYELTK